MPEQNRLPRYSAILSAQQTLRGQAEVTPLLHSTALDARCGARVFIKAETLQRTGSFKFRGAFNRIAAIPEAERARGIVAVSSGNHAQGVAEAARVLGLHACIVMPADAPSIKTERVRANGAEIVFYDRRREDRDVIAAELTAARGAVFVSPYDDPLIMAGQGTSGLEIVEQMQAQGLEADAVLVPCGGGGLTAGVALAVHEHWPDCAILTVEPEGFDETRRSLEAGERLENTARDGSICDALLSPMPGHLTFEINRAHVAGGLSVTDAEVLAAMAFAFDEMKLVMEPGGAVALAAMLAGRADLAGKTVCLIASGGNVSPETMMRALAQA